MQVVCKGLNLHGFLKVLLNSEINNSIIRGMKTAYNPQELLPAWSQRDLIHRCQGCAPSLQRIVSGCSAACRIVPSLPLPVPSGSLGGLVSRCGHGTTITQMLANAVQ